MYLLCNIVTVGIYVTMKERKKKCPHIVKFDKAGEHISVRDTIQTFLS